MMGFPSDVYFVYLSPLGACGKLYFVFFPVLWHLFIHGLYSGISCVSLVE